MTKMYCLDCKDGVETTYHYDEECGFGWHTCNECDGDDVETLCHCERCKKPCCDDDMVEGICYDCIVEIKKDFSYELEHIFANHSSSYRKAVNLAYDGETL